MKTKMIYKGKSHPFLTHGVQYEYYINIKGFGIHGSGQMKKMVIVTKESKSPLVEVYTSVKEFFDNWEIC